MLYPLFLLACVSQFEASFTGRAGKDDNLVDELFHRALNALPRHDAELDAGMLAKSVSTAMSRNARGSLGSRSSPHPVPLPSRSLPKLESGRPFVTGDLSPRASSDDDALTSMSRRSALTASLGGAMALLPLPSRADEETSSWFAITPKNDADIYTPPASVAGKTILITGANSGLGLESAKRLAQADAKVVLTARSQAKADENLAEVKAVAPKADVVALVLDLASLESIKAFPERYKAATGDRPIDVLMENAGVMAIPERLTTSDGFEKQVGINHLGHFALVAGMMPVLRKASNGFRIVLVSSEAHRFASVDSIEAALDSKLDPKVWPQLASVDSEGYSQWGAYGLSKAANVLFANELQRRFDAGGIRGSAVSLHPGGVGTGLKRYLLQGVEAAETGVPIADTVNDLKGVNKFLYQTLTKGELTVEQGANTQIYLAAGADTDGDLAKGGGKYFVDMKVGKPMPFTSNRELARKLWEVSETLTGTKIPV